MSPRVGRCLWRAGGLLARSPVLLLPVAVGGTALLGGWLALARVLLAPSVRSGLTEVERARLAPWLVLTAGLLVAAQSAYGAGFLATADRWLVDGRADWQDWADGARRYGAALAVRRGVGLVVAGALGLAWGLTLVNLWTGAGEWPGWGALAGLTGDTRGVWQLRGAGWLTRQLVLLALLGAAQSGWSALGSYHRAALVVEGGSVRTAWRFVVGTPGAGWRRAGLGQCVTLVTSLLCAAGHSWTLAALLVSLAAAWQALGDLMFYRACGGADRQPALAPRSVRERRPRVRTERRANELVVASHTDFEGEPA